MLSLYCFLCLSAVLHSSLSLPHAKSKAKPLNLAYHCVRIHTEKSDSLKNASPVIVVHGLGLSKESWNGIYQVFALQTGRKVCVVDLRNHGDSPWNDEYDVEAMSEDISLFLDVLQTEKAIIVGHSLGGKVSLHFTLKYPHKTEKLVIEDFRPNGITPEGLEEMKFFLGVYMEAIKTVPENATEKEAKLIVTYYINDMLRMFNSTDLMDPNAADVLPIRCTDGKCSWKTNTELVEAAIKDPDTLFKNMLSVSSGLYDGPSLFFYGAESPMRVNEDEENIYRLFPQTNLIKVEGVGHTIHPHPLYMDAVIKFINAGTINGTLK